MLAFDFTCFSMNAFLWLRIWSKIPHWIGLSCLFSFPESVTVSQLFCLSFVALTFLKGTSQLFCRKFLNLDLSDISLMVQLKRVMHFWQECYRSYGASFSVRPFMGTWCHCPLTGDVTLDYMVRWHLLDLPTVNVLLFFWKLIIILGEMLPWIKGHGMALICWMRGVGSEGPQMSCLHYVLCSFKTRADGNPGPCWHILESTLFRYVNP